MENKNRFDESNIVVSFGAISDIHINSKFTESTDKFRSALQYLSERVAIHGKGLDAVGVAGDLIDYHAIVDQINLFKDTYESVLDPEDVQLIYALGNHDVKWTSDPIEKEQIQAFEQLFGPQYFEKDLADEAGRSRGDHHYEINGYHFLTAVPKSNINMEGKSREEILELLGQKTKSRAITYHEETKRWLKDTLEEVTQKNPNQFVFLFTHPMMTDTCYGSDMGDFWETVDLMDILAKYPQVVTFGGHLHFSIHDERSIMQKEFTSLGCGSVRYMAIDDGKYEDMKYDTVMNDANEVSSGLLIQVDGKGMMQITRMNFMRRTEIKNAWIVDAPSEDKRHLLKYTPERGNAEQNAAPVMNGKAQVVVEDAGQSEVEAKLVFDAGTDDEMVHHYVITYGEAGSEAVVTKKILADFYLCDQVKDMKQTYTLHMGRMEKGKKYEGCVYCVDSWGAVSNKVHFDINVSMLQQ